MLKSPPFLYPSIPHSLLLTEQALIVFCLSLQPWNPASALVIPPKLSFSDNILSRLYTSSSDLPSWDHSNHRAFPPSLAVFLVPLAPGPGFPHTSPATLKCVIQV